MCICLRLSFQLACWALRFPSFLHGFQSSVGGAGRGGRESDPRRRPGLSFVNLQDQRRSQTLRLPPQNRLSTCMPYRGRGAEGVLLR